MSHWLVTQGDNQFSVDGLGELRDLAESGDLRAGDMIQPPGATDWIYAAEIPELKDMLGGAGDAEQDDDYVAERKKKAAMITTAAAAVLGGIAVVGGIFMFVMFQQMPRGDEVLIGEGGLTYSEMVVTNKGVSLYAKPNAQSGANKALEKDEVLDLMAKRGDFYKARTRGGAEGWVPYDAVIPMYQLGGEDIRDEYDPLYNPDRYVEVLGAQWMLLPEQEEESITVFQFTLRNRSVYPMTDLVILATIKDAKGHELEKVEIPVEGVIPPDAGTMVGTLSAEAPARGEEEGPRRLLTSYTFDEMAKRDPDLQLRYSIGVEVEMSTRDFTNANIDLIELRAMPDDAAAGVVTRRGGR